MGGICLECGNTTWAKEKLVLEIWTYDFEIGEIELIDEETIDENVGPEICTECKSKKILFFDIDPELRKKLANMDRIERLKTILLILLEDFDKKDEEKRIIDHGFFKSKEEIIECLINLDVSEDEIISRII